MSRLTVKRMDELKRGKSCLDCLAFGISIEWPTECLQFDHRDPDSKSGSIRQLIHHPELLEVELAKCDVVCANHHAIRTRFRGVSQKTREAIRKAKATPEGKLRSVVAAKKTWADPERRRRHSKIVAESQRTNAAREKNRVAQIAAWNDPDIRRARIDGQKLTWSQKSPEELSRKAKKAWETRRANEVRSK